MADPTFDKGQKLAELGAITPTDLYNYIAIADRSCKQHVEDLVQLVGAQMMMAPLAGLTRGDKQPGLSGPTGSNGNDDWTMGQVEGCLYAVGCDATDAKVERPLLLLLPLYHRHYIEAIYFLGSPTSDS